VTSSVQVTNKKFEKKKNGRKEAVFTPESLSFSHSEDKNLKKKRDDLMLMLKQQGV
jgi:hypothetical protein